MLQTSLENIFKLPKTKRGQGRAALGQVSPEHAQPRGLAIAGLFKEKGQPIAPSV